MIFKNRIKKEKLSADIESLNSRIETLSDQVKKFYSTEGELRRILENHIHGEVTGFSDKDTYYTWGILEMGQGNMRLIYIKIEQ